MSLLSPRPALFACAALLLGSPAFAQESPPTPPTLQAQKAELENQLRRQVTIAENARQEVAQLRSEAAVKDELLILARQRNAELYAVALEVIEKGIRARSIEPFLQGRRVRLENLKQSYEDRLNAARIFATTLPPSVQQRMDDEMKAKREASSAAPRN